MDQKSIYYLHVGDDDEITVVKLVEVEFVDDDTNDTGGSDTVDGITAVEPVEVELVHDDTNDTGGFDTVDGIELTTISIKYNYIIKNLYFYFFTIT